MVPLLLSYPTVILSNDLIIPVELGFHRMLILPLFSATTSTAVACAFKPGMPSQVAVFLWAVAFLLFELALLLGPVQASSLFLVIAELVLAIDSEGGRRSRLSAMGRRLAPLPLVSFAISWVRGRSYKALLTPCLSYLLLSAAVAIVYPRATVLLKTAMRFQQRQEQQQHQETFQSQHNEAPATGAKVRSTAIPLAALTFSLGLYLFSSLQPLMVFVFIGCLGVFFLSLSDAIEEQGPNFVLQNWIVCAVGVLAAVLQYLSFNTLSASPTGDLLTAVFVASCELISQRIIGSSSTAATVSDKSAGGQETPYKHFHSHHHSHAHEKSVLSQVAHDPGTRSIFSFLLLNTTFMFVQLLYSFRSKSLGLLSDSLHMALDCTSLLLGLVAGVLARRPPSDKYPFGLGHLETLAGFTNGVLLLGIVCGIFVEALSRLLHPTAVQETNELLVVATLGLVVNLFGLLAFDHGGHIEDSNNEKIGRAHV